MIYSSFLSRHCPQLLKTGQLVPSPSSLMVTAPKIIVVHSNSMHKDTLDYQSVLLPLVQQSEGHYQTLSYAHSRHSLHHDHQTKREMILFCVIFLSLLFSLSLTYIHQLINLYPFLIVMIESQVDDTIS